MKTLLLLLILLIVVLPVQAQDPLMPCTGANELYYTSDGIWTGNQVSDGTMQQLYSLSGQEFFDEANYRWEMPGDVQLTTFMMENEPVETRAMVTFYTSPTQPEWAYVIVYDNAVQTTDANGNHLGNHPCANARIPAGAISFTSAPQPQAYQPYQRPAVLVELDRQYCEWVEANQHRLTPDGYAKYRCE